MNQTPLACTYLPFPPWVPQSDEVMHRGRGGTVSCDQRVEDYCHISKENSLSSLELGVEALG
jgi:hypothetical protein